ncbi:MAG: hypothetical protein ACYTFG_16035, partial [Planctomycetota bacterium]
MGRRSRKKLRIQGLVREARTARERLVAGVGLHERGAFLEHVRSVVEKAEALCKQAGRTVRALPLPSRGAVHELRRIGAMSPHSIPTPRETGEPAPVRVKGIEKGL